jgi:DNA-binding NtrC family response regulator
MSEPKATILIAEDEEYLRNLLRTILERGGFDVLVAEDAQEALHIAREHDNRIDMLVSDIQMPGMTGLDLAKELKRFVPNLPVLLVSGYSQGVLLDSGWRFLQKPYMPSAILHTVRQSLQVFPSKNLLAKSVASVGSANRYVAPCDGIRT